MLGSWPQIVPRSRLRILLAFGGDRDRSQRHVRSYPSFSQSNQHVWPLTRKTGWPLWAQRDWHRFLRLGWTKRDWHWLLPNWGGAILSFRLARQADRQDRRHRPARLSKRPSSCQIHLWFVLNRCHRSRYLSITDKAASFIFTHRCLQLHGYGPVPTLGHRAEAAPAHRAQAAAGARRL
jgi:hypothetical protein